MKRNEWNMSWLGLKYSLRKTLKCIIRKLSWLWFKVITQFGNPICKHLLEDKNALYTIISNSSIMLCADDPTVTWFHTVFII